MTAATTPPGVHPATEPTLFERSRPGRGSARQPQAVDVDATLADLPPSLRRSRLPVLPEVAEPTLMRHFVRLSQRNHSIDSGFYPLGSCTMKYNPKVHDEIAALPAFARMHPLAPASAWQGLLELLLELQHAIAELAGLPEVTLSPAAGAHGEFTGLLLMRAWHRERVARGEVDAEPMHVLVPDTAHGTNPATVRMAGLRTHSIPTDERGGMDLDAVREACATLDIAGLMLTNPNTLGLLDEHILDIAEVVHGAGGLLYYDGANLNAIMGRTRPGDMGFDIVHVNVHKTLSTPHGGGGPGAGPVAVAQRLAHLLPRPRIVRAADGTVELDRDPAGSIGPVSRHLGNVGVLVRAWAYVVTHGRDGLRRSSELAVVNANYLLELVRDVLPPAFDRRCMHEFVVSGATVRRDSGVRALDIAKRLMDHGVHPPTMYFPLVVEEALMIEPTETETRETLDEFAAALRAVVEEAQADPATLHAAPLTTVVRRLDEARSVREPRLVAREVAADITPADAD
ncbi:MAG: glycine dehydrogenase (decarboxylating) beta subunit [Thermoleophilia bacterium]|nr:glycine dehydrogenase (decarboxylating) beta subunit [Thermoleophilia bacterium]